MKQLCIGFCTQNMQLHICFSSVLLQLFIYSSAIKCHFLHLNGFSVTHCNTFRSPRKHAGLPECIPVMKRPKMTIAGILHHLLKPMRPAPINTSTVALTSVPFLFGHTGIPLYSTFSKMFVTIRSTGWWH